MCNGWRAYFGHSSRMTIYDRHHRTSKYSSSSRDESPSPPNFRKRHQNRHNSPPLHINHNNNMFPVNSNYSNFSTGRKSYRSALQTNSPQHHQITHIVQFFTQQQQQTMTFLAHLLSP